VGDASEMYDSRLDLFRSRWCNASGEGGERGLEFAGEVISDVTSVEIDGSITCGEDFDVALQVWWG